MARRSTKAAAQAENPVHDRAHTISEKIGDQIRTLFNRNWRKIEEILEDGDSGNEIKLSFAVGITDRPPQTGEHASKDNRIITTMAFSEKTSDKIESAIPDPTQPDLPVTTSDDDAPAVP